MPEERFVVYRGFSRAYFHLPILFVFLYAGGLPVIVVEILLAVYGLVIIFVSPISGRLAQQYSLKSVIAAGEVLKAIGVALLGLGPNLGTALVGQVIAAAGYSLAVGTDSALLGALCAGDSARYRKYEANSASAIFAYALFGGVVGAYLFTRNARLPFWASVAFTLAALLVVLTLPSPAARRPGAAPASAPPVLPPAERYWLNYFAISRAFILAPFVGFLPYLFYVDLHVNLALFGVVLGLYSVAAFLVARASNGLLARFPARAVGWVSMCLTAVALVLLALAPTLPVGMLGVLLLGLGGGAVRPITMANLNAVVGGWDPAQRTALLSGVESRYGMWNTAILLIGGVLLGSIGLHGLLLALAAAYLVVMATLYVRGSSSRADELAHA